MAVWQGTLEDLEVNPKFWRGKKVLITGHTGFKGSWLSLWLQNLGAELIGYSLLPPTEPCLFELAHVERGMISINGDVRDLEHFNAVAKEHNPEILIHMAAQSLVKPSHSNPVDTYSTNVMGTVNTLELVRNLDCFKVAIIITSDKCYENKEWEWGYREYERLGGVDPYSNSKACAELITSAYQRSYFFDSGNEGAFKAVASVRAGNVIAGGDWAENRLIPDVMKAFMDDYPVQIRNPNAVRPWQHVLEPLDGYLTLAEKLWDEGGIDYCTPWNFGPNEEDTKTVFWVVDQLVKLWDGNVKWEEIPTSHPQEANYLKLDCSKSKMLLGWHPKLGLQTSLEWITEWYQKYNSNLDVSKYTRDQIQQYQDLKSC